MNYFTWEMGFLEWLNKIGNPFFDYLFWFISQAGGSLAIISILGILYWGISKDKGEKIAFTVFSGMIFNNTIKTFVMAKRPFEYPNYEYLRRLNGSKLSDSATGTSFPSGHSQNAGGTFGSCFLYTKNKLIRIGVCILMIIIPLSRLYLGVHFPHDVVTGLLIGIIYAILMYFLFSKLTTNRSHFILYIVFLTCFLPIAFLPNTIHDFYRSYGLLLGFVIGCFIEKKWVNFMMPSNFKQLVLRLLVGGVSIGIVYLGISFLPETIKVNKLFTIMSHMFITILAFGIVPFIFKRPNFNKGL